MRAGQVVDGVHDHVEQIRVFWDRHDHRCSVVTPAVHFQESLERILGCSGHEREVGVKEDIVGRDKDRIWWGVVEEVFRVEGEGGGVCGLRGELGLERRRGFCPRRANLHTRNTM